MPVGCLTPQRRIRIVNEHRPTGTVITAVGPIIEVITEEYRPARMLTESGPRRVEMRPVAVKMIGNITMAVIPRDDWILRKLEKELPDLPHNRGAVILIDGRAAVLQEVETADDEDSFTRWVWTDCPDRCPTPLQLESATVLHAGL
jgi:hypothetical protein